MKDPLFQTEMENYQFLEKYENMTKEFFKKVLPVKPSKKKLSHLSQISASQIFSSMNSQFYDTVSLNEFR